MPVLATFFSVRRGRDPFFKFFMQKLFPLQVERYEKEFGMRFLQTPSQLHRRIAVEEEDHRTRDDDSELKRLDHLSPPWGLSASALGSEICIDECPGS